MSCRRINHIAPNGEETRESLFSVLREGQRVVLWEHEREPLSAAALDAFLAAPTFSDRTPGTTDELRTAARGE